MSQASTPGCREAQDEQPVDGQPFRESAPRRRQSLPSPQYEVASEPLDTYSELLDEAIGDEIADETFWEDGLVIHQWARRLHYAEMKGEGMPELSMEALPVFFEITGIRYGEDCFLDFLDNGNFVFLAKSYREFLQSRKGNKG